MKVRQSVYINLPTEEVFAYVSDLKNLVNWSSTIITVRQISHNNIGVGTTVRSTIRFLGKWLDLTFEVAEYEPACYLSLKSTEGGTFCLLCYQFEPVDSGGTTVSEEAVIQIIEEIVHLEEPVITSTIRNQIEYDLLSLKDMLETRAPYAKSAE